MPEALTRCAVSDDQVGPVWEIWHGGTPSGGFTPLGRSGFFKTFRLIKKRYYSLDCAYFFQTCSR
jgi:hypothetical protein